MTVIQTMERSARSCASPGRKLLRGDSAYSRASNAWPLGLASCMGHGQIGMMCGRPSSWSALHVGVFAATCGTHTLGCTHM